MLDLPKWYRVDNQAATMLRNIKAFSMILGPCLKQQNKTSMISRIMSLSHAPPFAQFWDIKRGPSTNCKSWLRFNQRMLRNPLLTSRLLHPFNLEPCSSSDLNKCAKQAKDRNLAIVHASHHLRSGKCGLRLDEFTGSFNHLECGETNHGIQH